MPVTASAHAVTLSLPGSPDESAQVALHGATVFSYKHLGVERLFTSSKSDIAGPAAIRGGIPVCWPIFGPPPKGDSDFSKLKQHGFARISTWAFIETESGDDGSSTRAVFKLSPTPGIEALFAPSFALTYTVTLTAASLSVSLHVLSPSTANSELAFQALFHTYLHLPKSVSPVDVRVMPLTGLKLIDKVQGGAEALEERDVVSVVGPKGEVDRIYLGAPDTLQISYEGTPGGVTVIKKSLADVVLWNPGPEKGATIEDMEEGGAGRYICLEPGQVGEFVKLKPGEEWSGGITINSF